MPGNPDIVLPKYNTVIFVNGCFWHMHEECCPIFSTPKSNQEYWVPKLTGNKKRDEKTHFLLERLGWHIIVIWECELKKKVRDERLNRLLQELNDNFYKDLNNWLNNL